MIVQIYEIQTPVEAERCIELGVDHVGSVLLSEADWRQPGLKETLRVSDGARAKNSVIPLFQEMDTLYSTLRINLRSKRAENVPEYSGFCADESI